MSEKFHFAFPSERKRFDQLPPEKKESLINEAQEEAVGLNKKVDKFSDEGKEKSEVVGRLINNKEILSFLMGKYKAGITPIIEKLKDDIEKGVFDTLLSDDGGARLPTLIFKDILKIKGPENKETKVRFLALGQRSSEMYGSSYSSELEEYVRKNKDEWGKVLLVTEYVGTGSTLSRIRNMFENTGLTNYDIAALYSNSNLEPENQMTGHNSDGQRTFTGVVGSNDQTGAETLRDWSKRFSGVLRPQSPSPFPIRADKSPYKQYNEKEKIMNQETMNMARKIAQKVTQEIIDEVWNEG